MKQSLLDDSTSNLPFPDDTWMWQARPTAPDAEILKALLFKQGDRRMPATLANAIQTGLQCQRFDQQLPHTRIKLTVMVPVDPPTDKVPPDTGLPSS